MAINLVTKKLNIPAGTYAGVWSAYEITLKNGALPETVLKTEDGVRSLDGVEVTVTVGSDGNVTASER